MYDYESIIMDCHTCAEIGCGRRECSHKDADGCEAQLLIDAACAIDELCRVQLGADWISVEERLPGKDDMVFVYYEWTGQSGTVYKEVSLSTLGEIQHFGFKPIAWMPLPDLQKEETE